MSDSLSAEDLAAAAPASRAVGRLSRRALAIIVAMAVLGVLGVGWMADSIGGATPTPGQSALTRQVGLTTVTVTLPTAAQRATASEAVLLRVTDVTGRVVVGARAECALSMPAMAMSLPATQAEATATPGVYRCPAQGLSPGAWALALTLATPDGQTGHATFQFVVA
ncbi:MAG TPA: hypothetical protein VF739_14075 [Ktedonobacterales bacterium]